METKVPADVIPSPYEKLFQKYESFNAMQTKLLEDLLHSDKSIVLSAPTGSGKTVAFELAIVRMFHQRDLKQSSSNDHQMSPKAIYIAPIKALCNEIFENWKDRFNAIGINVSQLTGDTQSANLMTIQQSQIVISTPEKWDSLTRRWREFEELWPSVQLCIVDEVHLLNEDTRGPVLEVIVSRMKSSGVKRFIAASATIPNVKDLTNWLSNCNVIVSQYVFNDTERPVPLVKHILGVKTKLKGFQFDMKLNYQLPEIIRKFAENKAVLIFCNCRKSAEMAAFSLNKLSVIFTLSNDQKAYLNQLAQQLNEPKLRKLVEKGIAYHHAGLQYADRKLIESSFREGYLMILLSTSTLAMGINLPAHLVIIKSTETYMSGGFVEYPENMLLQMIGRAGRPQYDTKGVAVVLTQHEKIEKYKKLISGKSPIESHLHKHLTEHLNSEISLGTIRNLELAMDWIRSTYLYVRCVRNPMHYGFPADMSKSMIEHKLEELSLKQINELQQANLVKINHVNGFNLQTTEIGKLMAKYYLCFETMKQFGILEGNSTLKDIFDLIVKCKELNEFTLRVNEKNILNSLNKGPIRFPLKGRIKCIEQKISCLMQAVLGNIEIKAPGLVQESLKMFRIAERVSKCLLEFVRLCVQKNIYGRSENLWYKTLLNVFIAAKCIHVKLWENTEYALKQLHGIGNVYSTLLLNAGKITLKSIAETDANTIEHILNKAAPFGDEVLKNLILFPEYEIQLERKSTDFIQVYAKQLKRCYKIKPGSIGVLIVGDSFNNLLLLAENLDRIAMEGGQIERLIRIKNPQTVEYIYAHIIHTSFVGVDVHETLEINAPKIENAPKQNKKKPKKQTRLKMIRNDTVNDSDFLPEASLYEEDEEDQTKTDDIQMTVSKLKEFQFKKKSKLCHNEKDESKCQTEVERNENLLKIAKIKPLNETSYLEKPNDINTTHNSSCTIQRKLTDFFTNRKKSNIESTKPLKVDLKYDEMDRISIASSKETTTVQKVTGTNDQSTSSVHQNVNYTNALNKTMEIPKDPYGNFKITANQFNDSFPMKRKSILNDNTNTTFRFPAKKQRQQYDLEFTTVRQPLSLGSFLGISDKVQQSPNILNLSDKENSTVEQRHTKFLEQNAKYPIKIHKQSQQIFGKPLNSPSMQYENQKKENITSPLDLSKNFMENKPIVINAFNTKNSSKSNISLDNVNPSDEEFELFYKVALKFQRLPTDALSLKNFRYVFNKMLIKEKENKFNTTTTTTTTTSRSRENCDKLKNLEVNAKNHQLSKSKTNVFSMDSSQSSSSSNSFRLKLFRNDETENPTNNTIQRSTVKLINESVMKLVMATKFAENEFIDNMDIDEDLELVLSDLEKEKSYLFTQTSSNEQDLDGKKN